MSISKASPRPNSQLVLRIFRVSGPELTPEADPYNTPCIRDPFQHNHWPDCCATILMTKLSPWARMSVYTVSSSARNSDVMAKKVHKIRHFAKNNFVFTTLRWSANWNIHGYSVETTQALWYALGPITRPKIRAGHVFLSPRNTSSCIG